MSERIPSRKHSWSTSQREYMSVCMRDRERGRNIIIKAERSNQLHTYSGDYERESDKENTDKKRDKNTTRP